MATQTGRVRARVAARRVGGTLAVVTLSAGTLAISTLSFRGTASAKSSFTGKVLTISTERVAAIGTVLATSSGHTLYHYAHDPAGKATCTGVCAKTWSPLLLPRGAAHIKPPHGVKGLGVIHAANGRLQATFHQEPLYVLVNDKKGHAGGQGVENDWFAVLSNGQSSAPNAAASTTPPTPAPTTKIAPVTRTTMPPVTMTTNPPVTTRRPAPTTMMAPPTTSPTTTTAPGTGGVAF